MSTSQTPTTQAQQFSPEFMDAMKKLDFAVRCNPTPVIGFDVGGQRQKDFDMGFNAAKEQVWIAYQALKAQLPSQQE